MKDIINYFKNLGYLVLLGLLCVIVGICGPATTRLLMEETKKEAKKTTKKKK